LQERTYEPLGSVEPVDVDVRVVAATNKDLGKLVRKGAFRQDLFYRINIVRLKLPELRDHREDIPLLVDRFISKFNRLQSKDVAGVSDETLATLMESRCLNSPRQVSGRHRGAAIHTQTGSTGMFVMMA